MYRGGGRQEEVYECTGAGEDRRRYVNVQGWGRQEEVCECTGVGEDRRRYVNVQGWGKTGGGM